jgi:hypothetical protein
MRSQAQYTIYSLNDVYTGTSAPQNPYTGQLWVDTSQSPPLTKVYNGSAWKEQNGTDTIKSNVQTLTTKQATFETNLTGLTSTVSTHTTQISTISDAVDSNTEEIEELQSDMSSLQQTATEISAEVSHKVNESYGDQDSSFGWSLTSNGFTLTSDGSTVMSVTSSGLTLSGTISCFGGTIGGFTIKGSYLHTGTKTSYSSTTSGVYIGTNGIGLGAGNFYVSSSGSLYTKSGTIGCFTLNSTYMYAGSSGTTNYVLIGQLSSSRTVCGHSLSNWGLILGTKFGVTRAGVVYGTDVHVTGEITATSGTFDNCTLNSTCNLYGKLLMSGTSNLYLFGSRFVASYDTSIGIDGIITDIITEYHEERLPAKSYTTPYGLIVVPDFTNRSVSGVIMGVSSSSEYDTSALRSGIAFVQRKFSSYEGEMVAKVDNLEIINVKRYSGANTVTWSNSSLTSTCYGTWYFYSQAYFGTSTTGYQIRIDSDQITFYYDGAMKGELETYSGYVDVQGTWKTNGNNWISSSDRRIKKDILDFDESYELLFDNLKPRQYRYIDGNKGRVHSGFIAQEVSDAVIAAGKTIDENAYVCAFENKEGETYYGLRYEELIALNTWQIQKLKQRIKQLEDKLL